MSPRHCVTRLPIAAIPWAHETVSAAASFGVTQALPGEINIASIVGRADAALYRAKEDGRNAVRAATETVVVVEAQERRVTESA